MLVYCVEDDASVRDIEIYTLRTTGFEAEGFETSEAFFAALRERVPDLVILDVMLPGEDGVSVLRRLRSHPATAPLPVIMATAKSAEYDKVHSLDLGADDYLVKPFGMMEMVSRVRAVLRRTSPGSGPAVLEVGPLRLDPDQRQVSVDGEAVSLTLKEFELLRCLMMEPRRVLSREHLLAEVWDVDFYSETRTVDMHVTTLRKKLGTYASMIETVRGVGYRLVEPELS